MQEMLLTLSSAAVIFWSVENFISQSPAVAFLYQSFFFKIGFITPLSITLL